jgi:uncharacterized membrane protein YeaQ/YmgE (transglycosylase-associated protein family)
MSVGFVAAVILSAFITGGLARFALPGPDPMPIWLTIGIGLIGSIVGAVVGDQLTNGNGVAVSFVSFGVAIALVALYRVFVQKRPVFGPDALKFPERGIGVEHYRERLRKAGFDPDSLRPPQLPQPVQPDPQAAQEARLTNAIDELRRAGVLDDEEVTTLRDRLNEPKPEA